MNVVGFSVFVHLYFQNVGKALRYSWKCLVVGLQNVSLGYSMPVSAIVPEIHRVRSHP